MTVTLIEEVCLGRVIHRSLTSCLSTLQLLTWQLARIRAQKMRENSDAIFELVQESVYSSGRGGLASGWNCITPTNFQQ